MNKILIIDAYNIIFAWDELALIAKKDLALARDILIDILSNYQGFTNKKIILVFDSYKVKGAGIKEEKSGLQLIFTKYKESADHYIEKYAKNFDKKSRLTVVTSDFLEQVMTASDNVLIMSARELKLDVDNSKNKMKKEYLEKTVFEEKNTLFSFLDEDTKKWLKDLGSS